MLGDNFSAIFEGIDSQTLADLNALYEAEAIERLKQNAALRQLVGYENRQDHRAIDGIGAVNFAPTPTDYFWQQRLHNETFDEPGFRRWFMNTPDGEYARVDSKGTRMQVGFTGEGRRVSFHKSYG